jgi:hypothetical protein
MVRVMQGVGSSLRRLVTGRGGECWKTTRVHSSGRLLCEWREGVYCISSDRGRRRERLFTSEFTFCAQSGGALDFSRE